MKPLLPIALAAILNTGCAAMLYTSIDEHTPPPPDWPVLTVKKHYVTSKEMRDVCSKYGPAAGIVACAEPDLDAKTCDIWLVKEFPDAYVEWHEEMHCKGYDHPGGTEIQRLMAEGLREKLETAERERKAAAEIGKRMNHQEKP